MAIPEPRPGLVVRYDYLWHREAKTGRSQSKDRPACIVAAIDSPIESRFVVLLAITHSQPEGDTVGVAIPLTVGRALGLDDAPSWVIVSEYNVDNWPNAGLTSVPEKPGAFEYGFVPPRLFALIKARFLELAVHGQSQEVRR